MKTCRKIEIRLVIRYLILSMVLTSCSGESTETDHMTLGHSHSSEIDMEKHLFEHEFAQQCIVQKTQMSISKDAKSFTEPCMCIAKYLLKDLAAKESYQFLNDKKYSKLLNIKYQQAVELCL